MSNDHPQPRAVPGLPAEVVARIVAELGRRANKVIDCLRTAAALIDAAHADGAELRFAESAAYNLREALDAVVDGRRAAEGGIGTVLEAWQRYKLAVRGPSGNLEAARAELDGVLERLEQDEERQSFKTRKLLEYVRDQTGIAPLPGEHDPTRRYSSLRERANSTLHDRGTVSAVAALYDDAIAWFIRFLTPPDDRVRALTALAERPYAPGLVDELRHLVLNSHHVCLFLSRLRDAAWLDALYDAGMIRVPVEGEPWPVPFLVGGAGSVEAAQIAEILNRLVVDMKEEPKARRLGIARQIIQCASRLGAAGHAVATNVIAKYPSDDWVQTIALSIADRADPTDPIQFVVADAVLGNERRSAGGYGTRRMLARLAAGLTVSNVADRVRMVAAKIRRLAEGGKMRFVAVDSAALHIDADDINEPVLILAHHFVTMIPLVRDLGLSTHDLLRMSEGIPGELGERIVCQVLAGADDVERDLKVGHIERRMRSEIATGDDRDLIEDILTNPLSPDELERWRTALGEPSPASDTDEGQGVVGDNWARAWRWSMILPSEVREGWEEAIAAVTAQHGEPTPTSLDTRISLFTFRTGQSPYSREELAELPILDAAALVSAWRRGQDNDWGVSARELARELEAVVEENPRDWTEDSAAVVTTLREPVYVDHYVRAITHKASDLTDRIDTLMEVVAPVGAEPWTPAAIGRNDFEYEPDWSGVKTAIVKMIAAFANNNSEIADHLDVCWELASELVRILPEQLPGLEAYEHTTEYDDPLNRAINRSYGVALETVLALGGWEHRNQGTASERLVQILDEVLAVPGAVGLELRAVLASRRPFLESVARDWIETRASEFFDKSPLGLATFDQTLKWSRPTKWFFNHYQAELVAAARRGAHHSLSWLLVALLWDEPAYTFSTIIKGLAGDVPALKAAADSMAALMQDVEADDPMLERGLQFWQDMLDANRSVVPAKALIGMGRWAFVNAVSERRWRELMDRTVRLTDGEIDMAIEIADRCKKAQPSSPGLRILRMMIGHGEPWEQHHIETAGVEALRTAAEHAVDEDFHRLRTRLIERGRHEAADITPKHPET